MSTTGAREASRQKNRPTPARPRKQAPAQPQDGISEDGNTAGIAVEEVLAEYEAQIGNLSGQLIQRDLIIRKLRAELVNKNRTGSDVPHPEASTAD